MSSTKSYIRHRASAYQRQHGRCFYCHAPMWQDDPRHLIDQYGLSPNIARTMKCTAEHLKPRLEGGGHDRQNIVAACARCNQLRHRARRPLSPQAYRRHVQRRLAHHRWWPETMHDRLKKLLENDRFERCQAHFP